MAVNEFISALKARDSVQLTGTGLWAQVQPQVVTEMLGVATVVARLTGCPRSEPRLVFGLNRYTFSARFYDVLSMEWPIYRAGRVAAIRAMELRSGMRVLDLGCGTGLNHPLLQEAIGPTGAVVGVDTSWHMLAQARQRASHRGWSNVELLQADMTEVDGIGAVDAVLATYSLSLVPGWELAWARAMAATRTGGRMAIVDMQLPVGAARIAAPLARLACAAGGADINAHPWTALERDCLDVRAISLRGGHIQVRVGDRR